MPIIPRPWERDAAWRALQFELTSSATHCALCGQVDGHLHAMPRNTDHPYRDLLAVCGQCKPNAMTRRVLEEEDASFSLSPWAVAGGTMPPEPVPLPPTRLGHLTTGDDRADAFAALRALVLARDHFACAYCDVYAPLVDRALPGPLTPANAVAVCRACLRVARGTTFVSVAEKRAWVQDRRGLTDARRTVVDGPVTPAPRQLRKSWHLDKR